MRTLVTLSLLLVACDPSMPSTDAGPSDGSLPTDSAFSGDADPPPPTDAGSPLDSALPDAGPLGEAEVVAPAGRIQGRRIDGVDVFLGIPFGAPTGGEARFRPPTAAAPFDFLEAVDPGPGCPRIPRGGALTGDEDCLKLHVWRAPDAEDRPVMVFLHGGAFVNGSGSESLYDGTVLAEKGVVLVSLNYRIGLLGFLASDELLAEGGGDTVGNYGLRDQLLALQWIQDNIAAFGGDPDNVTVFGESAGGVSICALLAVPSAEGLFHQAIMESAPDCGFPTPAEAAVTSDAWIAEVGCDTAASPLECMRLASAGALVDAANAVTGGLMGGPRVRPVADGRFLMARTPETPAGLDVPLLVGSNAEESRIFALRSGVTSLDAYRAHLTQQFGDAAGAVFELYPATGNSMSVSAALRALWTDVAFRCVAFDTALSHHADGSPTYVFEFLGTRSADHGAELPYVFGNFERGAPSAADQALSEALQTVWIDFATTGRADAHVPRFDPPSTTLDLVLADPVTTADHASDLARCEALRGLGVDFGT
ncbi:MAG: carboxylesterase/lipase family protein [Sandaracinaceae bacterium]